MNQPSLLEGDPPGQVIRIAPYEPRDSQGRTLEVARYQDRSRREEDVARRLCRYYHPLLLLDRLCDYAARAVMCLLPFNLLILWILIILEMQAWLGLCVFVGAMLYLVLYTAWICPSLRNCLQQIQRDAQAHGVDLSASWRFPGGLNE